MQLAFHAYLACKADLHIKVEGWTAGLHADQGLYEVQRCCSQSRIALVTSLVAQSRVAAAVQESGAQLMTVSNTAEDGQAMLEALEAGVAGIVLRTNDPAQVRYGWKYPQ